MSGSLKIMVFKHQVWHAVYVLVFGNYRVKMLIQHQDRSWTQVVQAHAIEQVGGILLGYHWSNLPYCMPNWFITAQHVYFVWGKTNYEAILRKGNSCRHILPSGMWIEESAVPENIHAYAAYKGFKLAVFDSDASYRIWQSLVTLSDFFKSVIELLEKHKDWKALFKFKFAEASLLKALPDGADLAARVAALIEEGRLYIAHPSLSPITAGKISDLSLCYTLNSAGICAQIRGAKAVHWDAVGI